MLNKISCVCPSKDIIEARIKRYENDESCSDDDRKIIKFLNIIMNEKITGESILPLFNYDYRRFISATLDIIQNNFIDLDSISYRDIPNKVKYKGQIFDMQYGKRGILFNAYHCCPIKKAD